MYYRAILNNKIPLKKIRNVIMLFFVLSPLVFPDFLREFEVANLFIRIYSPILFLGLSFLTIIKKKINIHVALVIIFLLWRSISSEMIHNSQSGITTTLVISSLVLIVNLLIENYTQEILSALSLVFTIYIILNFLSLLIYPNGLFRSISDSGQIRPQWIFGIGNQFNYFITPGIVISALSSWYKKNRVGVLTLIILIIGILSVIIAESMTGLVSLVFLGFFLYVVPKRVSKRTSFSTFLTGYLILFILLVVLNSTSFFQNIIVNYLGRDLTLSGRVGIWQETFRQVSETIAFGNGINAEVLYNNNTFAAHNMILQILLESGLIGFIIFLFLFFISGKKLQKNSKSYIVFIVTIGIFSILIGGLSESYRLNHLFLLLTFAYNSEHLLNHEYNHIK